MHYFAEHKAIHQEIHTGQFWNWNFWKPTSVVFKIVSHNATHNLTVMFKFNFDLDDLLDDPELNTIHNEPPSVQLDISDNYHSSTEATCKELSLQDLVGQLLKQIFFFGLYSDTRIKNSLTHYLPSYPVLPWSYLLPTAQNLSLSLDEIFSMRVFNWSQKAMQDQYQMLMTMTKAKRPSNLLLQLERSIDMFPPSGLLKRPPILCHTYTKVD